MSHQSITPFDPTTIGVLDFDSNTKNLLIRGNMPLQGPDDPSPSYFAYGALSDAICPLVNPLVSNFDLKDYYLVDVSLIDNQGDLIDLNAEFACFSVVPSDVFTFPPRIDWPNAWPPYLEIKNWAPTTQFGTQVMASSTVSYPGSLIWWPVQSCESSANCESNVVSSGYDFVGLVAQIKTLMNTAGSSPKLIYIHCNSGVNRTGAANVSYFLTYGSSIYSSGKPMTLKESYEKADSLGPRQTPGPGDEQLVQAYCNYISSDPPATTPTCSQCTYLPSESR